MKKIRIGLAGTGKMGSAYATVLKGIKNFELTCVVGRDYEKTKKFSQQYGIPNFGINFNNFKNIDALIVAISEEKLASEIKKIIQLNVPVLFEKPLGINFLETTKIVKSLSVSKNNFFVATNRRFFNSVIELKKRLERSSKKFFYIVNDQQDQKFFSKKKNWKKQISY